MKAILCDFCGRRVEKTPLPFKGPQNLKCRIVVQKIVAHKGKRGVRWHDVDVCLKCLSKNFDIAKRKAEAPKQKENS